MKIVYIRDNMAQLGGVEKIFTDKMNYLADIFHHEVYLITVSQGNHPYAFPLSKRIKHIDLHINSHLQYKYRYPLRWLIGKKMDYMFRTRFKQIVSQINPDFLITTTYYKVNEICELKCKAKKIVESHCAKSHTGLNEGIKRAFPIQWLYERRIKHYENTVKKKFDMIVALTKGDALEWNTTNVRIIPNMTDNKTHALCRYSNKNIISAGRLEYQKGFDLLIRAWNIVNKIHPSWKLSIYGDGNLRQELIKQIKDANLENSITIYHPVKNIYSVFCDGSIYVMPSRYEGFGLVLAEAMSTGLPCIAFDCPYGPSEIITHQQNGLLVENGNITELAKAICHLIENEPLRKKYGIDAQQKVKRYAPENIMEQWNQLFKSLQS